MSTEPETLIESLERATGRLASAGRGDAREIERAVGERASAIEAITEWIGGEQRASRSVPGQLAERLARDLEAGREILVQLALDRETKRAELARLGRELRMLRGLGASSSSKPTAIDYQG